MATLEESFLADLADLSDDGGGEDDQVQADGDDIEMQDSVENARNYDEVGAVARLSTSSLYVRVMEGVREALNGPQQSLQSGTWTGAAEEDPAYKLLLECLELVVAIDNETANLHNYTKDKYRMKFPELASFVHDPVQYARTVQRIGNAEILQDISLDDILPQHVIMGVAVTITTTDGKPLDEDTLQRIQAAGDIILQLDEDKALILELVQNSMHRIAPNLSQAVGEEIAARLIGVAGGLLELSRMPACNVQVLGAKRKILSGFSTANAALHQGFIYSSEIIQNCPEEFRSKAARVVGAKCTLLARIDAYGSDPSGSQGATMKEEIVQKIEKWQELPPGKTKNVLPVPDLEPKKRRGGKRWRRMKEKYGVTDIQKAQNRMKFNEAEEEILDGDEVVGLGVIGKGGIGKLGSLQARQSIMKMSNKTQKRLNQQSKRAGITTSMIAGTSSSLAFTPVQGIELQNPSARPGTDSKSGTQSVYFSDYAGFNSVTGTQNKPFGGRKL